MAESLMHELNIQFNDMGLNAKKETKNKNRTRGKKIDRKDVFFANEKPQDVEHCMPYHTLTDNQDTTFVCASCGSNLYSDIIKEDASNEKLCYQLVCPRGCEQLPTDHFDDEQLHIPPMEALYIPNYQPHPLPHNKGNFHKFNIPTNAGYTTSYNPYQPQHMATMSNNDYRFHPTTELTNARTARLNQLLNAVDCDNCHPMTIKERTNRFEAFKRKNVRRAEYQLRSAKHYGDDVASSTPDFSSDLSSMAEGMFEYSERIRRFYEQTQYGQGCEKCGGMQ